MLYLTVTLLKVFPAQRWFHSAFAKMPGRAAVLLRQREDHAGVNNSFSQIRRRWSLAAESASDDNEYR